LTLTTSWASRASVNREPNLPPQALAGKRVQALKMVEAGGIENPGQGAPGKKM